MSTEIQDLYLKLSEGDETDINYLIRVLELSSKSNENSLKAFRQGLDVSIKRNDKYAIKQWQKKIDLYEKMIEKNYVLINKLRIIQNG